MATEEERNAELMERSRQEALPGYAAEQRSREAQQGFLTNVADSFKNTNLAKAWRRVSEEAPILAQERLDNFSAREARTLTPYSQYFQPSDFTSKTDAVVGSLFGVSSKDPKYKPQDHAEELTKGVPVQFWEDILDHNNLGSAQRERARILENLQRANRLDAQKGVSPVLASIVGGFLDVDAPLIAASGGALGGYKLARGVYKAGRALGLSSGAARLAGSTSMGALAGAEAGAANAIVGEIVDPTQDWTDHVATILGGATLGATFGTMFRGDAAKAISDMQNTIARHKVTGPDRIDDDVDLRAEQGAFTFPGDDTPLATGESTAGAQQVPGTQYAAGLQDPFRHDLSSDEQAIIQNAANWMRTRGAVDDLNDIENTTFGQLLLKKREDMSTAQKVLDSALTVNASDTLRFYRSNSNVMRMLGINFFENSTSLGRGTVSSSAATLKEVYERRMGSVMIGYKRESIRWAKDNGYSMRIFGKDTGLGISQQGQTELNRRVMMNLNDIDLGRAPRDANDPTIMKLVNMVGDHNEMALGILKGSNPTRYGVKGMENVQVNRGYAPQRGNGNKMRADIKNGVVTRQQLEDAFRDSYMAAGMSQEGAEITARAFVGRALAGDLDIDTSMIDLLTEDGRAFLRDRLQNAGMATSDLEQLVAALVGQAEFRGREGFTKHRNSLDYGSPVRTNDGSQKSIVDYLDTDVETVHQKYRMRTSGSAAMARKGIRSRMDLNKTIDAARTEMRSLGEEPPDSDWYHAMFSDFFGGPGWGYAGGKLQEGVEPGWSIAKDVANLSLLGQLGFAQLIDSGNAMATDGFRNWLRHSKAMTGLDKDLRDTNNGLLDEISVLAGEIGKDHLIYRPHLNMDEVSVRESKEWVTTARQYLASASQLNAYTSLFNTVRQKQQEVAASILANKVLRYVKAGEHTDRIKYDLGVDDRLFDSLVDMINNGTIEFKSINGHEFVNRLNVSRWSQQDIDDFGSIMVRGQNQIVQKSMIGEQDMWTRTNVGGMLTHLKTFPMTAITKQMIRNARYMDTEAMGTALYGIGVAYVALTARDVMNGRERAVSEQARNAVAYSNMFGWTAMAWDPAMTMLGLDEYRMQRYGRHYEMTLAPIDVANRLIKVPGAAISAATGNDLTASEKQSLLAIPFMRTLGIGQWLVD